MSWLGSVSTAPWERALGWTLLLALWQTTLLALLVRGVFHHLGRPGPRRRYSVAWAALWIALLFGAASLWALLWHPVTARQTIAPLVAPATQMARLFARLPHQVSGSNAAMQLHPSHGAALHPLHWAAWLWLAAVVALAARLLGGWLLARRVLDQAVAATNPRSSGIFSALVARMDAPRNVRLLESPEVDAPVTLRWRQPAVVFPRGLVDEIAPEAFEALAAHELAHVVRRDYLASLAQGVPDTLLFFSPGVRWLSARAREAREQCCDDRAVAACGSSSTYAAALAAVAERGYSLGVGVLGAAAPRLTDRIRRLAEGDAMLRLNRTGRCALAAGLVLFMALALRTSAASVEEVGSATRPGAGKPPIPIAYSWEQPGAPLRIAKSPESTSGYLFASVRVRNVSELPLQSVTFVAVVEKRPGARRTAPAAQVFTSDPVAARLQPGEAADLAPNLLPPDQLARIAKDWGVALPGADRAPGIQPAPKIRAWLGVLQVAYDDGRLWRLVPLEGATTAQDALHLRRESVVSRNLVVTAPPTQLLHPPWCCVCADDAGLEYSEGAPVPIRDEPGHFAVCHRSGAWVEKRPQGRSAAAWESAASSDSVSVRSSR